MTMEGYPHLLSRRRYLVRKQWLAGVSLMQAIMVVADLETAHPEWDMHELRTWEEWEAST